MPGKRLFEDGDHQSQKIALALKRPNVSSTREFPSYCGPNAKRGSHYLSGVETCKSPKATRDGVPIAAKPLTILAASDSKLKYVKPNAGKVDAVNQDCSFSEKTLCKPAELPSGSNFKWKEDESEICILSSSEWKQLQTVFESNKGTRAKSLFEHTRSLSEDCSRTGKFAEVDMHKMVVNFDEEVEVTDLKNWCIVPYDEGKANVIRKQVQAALKLFEESYTKLVQEHKAGAQGGQFRAFVHTKAAILLRDQKKWLNFQPMLGHIPGIEIGDQFEFRAELAVVGLHHQFISGIDFMTADGKKYAISIVDSGRYENKIISLDIFVYSGQGGNAKVQSRKGDQKLEGGNLALKNSMDANYPVRVIRKTVVGANTGNSSGKKMYIYVGLYTVRRFWQKRVGNDNLAFMFEFVRMPDQKDCSHEMIEQPREAIEYFEDMSMVKEKIPEGYFEDVSQDKERIPIRIVNHISNEMPPPFTYISKMKYPTWYDLSVPMGCDCIDGCSDSNLCSCVINNGWRLPFNEEGSILRAKRLVHECGPSCQCPPSCQNRVGQHGPKYQLEVFKTTSTGWGVRSRDDIPSGGFICEYIGEVLRDNEAEQRIDNDEYLFDLENDDGFTVDAAKYGNVGRFLNHSCSPNLYAQNILYDHDDKRMPHIMFFATKNIPALQELTYDYNYKIDRVCDANGNAKKRICYCGSRKCNGRMY